MDGQGASSVPALVALPEGETKYSFGVREPSAGEAAAAPTAKQAARSCQTVSAVKVQFNHRWTQINTDTDSVLFRMDQAPSTKRRGLGLKLLSGPPRRCATRWRCFSA